MPGFGHFGECWKSSTWFDFDFHSKTDVQRIHDLDRTFQRDPVCLIPVFRPPALTHPRKLATLASNQRCECSVFCSMSFGEALEDLLDMHVHLPQHGWRYGTCIGLIGQKGHALLDAERLEDHF